MQHMFRALRHRNYRLFFTGQSLSLIGTWMQSVALSWLVYRLTASPFLLGVVSFSGQIPTFFLAPFAGVLSDRLDRRRLLLVSQCLAMVQASFLCVLFFTGHIAVWHIIVLSVFLGLVNGLDMPVRQSFMIEIVGDSADLPNAIALNSSMINGTRLVGPTLAGLLIAVSGEGVCFALNMLSFFPIVLCVLLMKITGDKKKKPSKNFLKDFSEGLAYVGLSSPFATILVLVSVVSLVGMPYLIFMPVFARDILHGGPQTQGLLMASAGLGALSGALYLASRRSVLGLGRVLVTAVVLFGAGISLFALSGILILSMLLLVVCGFGMIATLASCNTLLQTIVDHDKRGRVMSLYTMSFIGMAPLGSLVAGYTAQRIGAPHTLLVMGVSCVAAGVGFVFCLPRLRAQIRPIYMRKGIMPQVASGLQSATELSEPPED